VKVSDLRAAALAHGGPGRWSLNDLRLGRVPDEELADVLALLAQLDATMRRILRGPA
jgi:hypothetical protein